MEGREKRRVEEKDGSERERQTCMYVVCVGVWRERERERRIRLSAGIESSFHVSVCMNVYMYS